MGRHRSSGRATRERERKEHDDDYFHVRGARAPLTRKQVDYALRGERLVAADGKWRMGDDLDDPDYTVGAPHRPDADWFDELDGEPSVGLHQNAHDALEHASRHMHGRAVNAGVETYMAAKRLVDSDEDGDEDGDEDYIQLAAVGDPAPCLAVDVLDGAKTWLRSGDAGRPIPDKTARMIVHAIMEHMRTLQVEVEAVANSWSQIFLSGADARFKTANTLQKSARAMLMILHCIDHDSWYGPSRLTPHGALLIEVAHDHAEDVTVVTIYALIHDGVDGVRAGTSDRPHCYVCTHGDARIVAQWEVDGNATQSTYSTEPKGRFVYEAVMDAALHTLEEAAQSVADGTAAAHTGWTGLAMTFN